MACLGKPGSGIASGAGLAFATGPTEVFLSVSVSAAKLSAVVMEGEVDGGEESEAMEESDEGDLLLLRRCTGRGAGTGGLEASAPWGRSITRSGVCFGFRLVAGVEVRDSQNPRRPCGPLARGASSSLVGVEVVRRSQRSRFLRKLPLPSSLCWSLLQVLQIPCGTRLLRRK